MFDFRYHVASLAAVFLALIIGILVGVGISGTGFVRESERERLNRIIDDARADRDTARSQRDALRADAAAAQAFVDEAYPLVMEERLRGRRIAVVSVGAPPTAVDQGVGRALTDADATLVRSVTLTLPGDMSAITRALRGRQDLADQAGRWASIGSRLGRELVRGDQELLPALASLLVQERSGSGGEEIDGLVVYGPVPADADTPRAELLRGLYASLGGSVVAAAVEARDARPGSVAKLAAFGFATIDDVDAQLGRVALAGVLSGDRTQTSGKRYGVKTATAEDGYLPPLDPIVPAGG
jgi:copper transport outer membrane protein MctB